MAVVKSEIARVAKVSFSINLGGGADGVPFINADVNDEVIPLTVKEAKELHAWLGECVEIAAEFEFFYRFFTTHLEMTPEKAFETLHELRSWRNGPAGSRVKYPKMVPSDNVRVPTDW